MLQCPSCSSFDSVDLTYSTLHALMELTQLIYETRSIWRFRPSNLFRYSSWAVSQAHVVDLSTGQQLLIVIIPHIKPVGLLKVTV